MRLSESIRKNVLETLMGGLINKFKVSKRRSVLFSEDILSEYIRECEKHDKEKIREIGHRWGSLGTDMMLGKKIGIVPNSLIVYLVNKVWKNIDLVEDGKMSINKKNIEVRLKNESITRVIGRNEFIIGFVSGCTGTLLNTGLIFEKYHKENNWNVYNFSMKGKRKHIPRKSSDLYYKSNVTPKTEGCDLKHALRTNFFRLRGNTIYFRNRRLMILENTLFHLIGNENLLMDKVTELSYNYFKETLKERSSDWKFIKTILQISGWGIVNIVDMEREVKIEIRNPPYCMQAEKDN